MRQPTDWHQREPVKTASGVDRMVRERSSITSARFGGVGSLSQNADNADALEGGGGFIAKMLTC